jgi:ribosome-associated heat shock protein Hsp15|tara:strand:- start:80 stop:379 length:300 start_codon:yes stop_codon:yes gene_type:complete
LNKVKSIDKKILLSEQRIDNWLFRTRILKSRAKAQKIISEGLIKVNKIKIEKSSIKIKVGDIVTLIEVNKIIIFSVENFANKRLSAKKATRLYKEIKIV